MGSVDWPTVDILSRWGVSDLLNRHKRLRLMAAATDQIVVSGWLDFVASKPGSPQVEDSFELRLEVPFSFPDSLPLVYPQENRIPSDFHRLECGALCLGSPTRQRLALATAPNLASFIDRFVIPYLYAFVLHEQGFPLPFGELAHGRRGLIDDFKSMFQVTTDEAAKGLVYLTSRPKRKANRQLCPCGSRQRLSKCKGHHSTAIRLRKTLGRPWFQAQHRLIAGGTIRTF